MIKGSVTSRIVKLEASQRRSDEILLVWREPDSDIATAVSVASFNRGDRVICAEWFGELPLPKPKWYRDRITQTLDENAKDYLYRSMQRLVDDEPRRDPALLPPPSMAGRRMAEMSDNELLHAAMGGGDMNVTSIAKRVQKLESARHVMDLSDPMMKRRPRHPTHALTAR